MNDLTMAWVINEVLLLVDGVIKPLEARRQIAPEQAEAIYDRVAQLRKMVSANDAGQETTGMNPRLVAYEESLWEAYYLNEEDVHDAFQNGAADALNTTIYQLYLHFPDLLHREFSCPVTTANHEYNGKLVTKEEKLRVCGIVSEW